MGFVGLAFPVLWSLAHAACLLGEYKHLWTKSAILAHNFCCEVTDCYFFDLHSESDGGAIYFDCWGTCTASSLIFNWSQLINVDCAGNGGGIYTAALFVSMTGACHNQGSAMIGGFIYLDLYDEREITLTCTFLTLLHIVVNVLGVIRFRTES
jgi:hypothetical protein